MTTDCLDARPETGLAHRVPGNGIARLFATLGEWRRRSRDRDQLARLDDRMLSDIGISRAEAQILSSKPFWRE
jgi:uncharacterized protein YjiS (DUF1127 family)